MQIPEQKVMVKQSEGHVFNSGVAKRISITPLLKCACSFILLRNLYIERVRVVKRSSCLVWIIGRCATNTNRIFLEKKTLDWTINWEWNETRLHRSKHLTSFLFVSSWHFHFCSQHTMIRFYRLRTSRHPDTTTRSSFLPDNWLFVLW